MPAKAKKPIIEGLFSWPSNDPRLIASRCKKCKSISFPARPFCPNPDCEKERKNVEEIQLSKQGTLYSFGVQQYPPPLPFRYEPWQPYALGMVDFPEGIRIWGIISRTEDLKIGMPVETTIGKLYEDEENEYLSWIWKPID